MNCCDNEINGLIDQITNFKQCGRQVRPIQYAPARLFDHFTLKLVYMRVASKVGNLHSKLGLGFWVLELFTMYMTDGRMDKRNAYCLLL